MHSSAACYFVGKLVTRKKPAQIDFNYLIKISEFVLSFVSFVCPSSKYVALSSNGIQFYKKFKASAYHTFCRAFIKSVERHRPYEEH